MTTVSDARTASDRSAGPPAECSTPAIELRGVVKAYGGTPVLDGVDLAVPVGSLTAVLGPSGCGKTTLLRLLAGFETVDAGNVVLHGRTVDDGRRRLPPERRRIGYVPQEGALFPHLSVAANIGFGLPRGAQRRGRVAELLELVGLPDLGQRHPHQLSGGQQQRVALARALATDPHLVLLDEPFSALDAGLRGELRCDVAAALRRRGTTAVLVTHDQDEALSVADLVAVLRDGRIVQAGSPPTVYQRPVDAEVARFVGAANLLAGQVRAGRAHCVLGALPLVADGPPPAAEATVMIRPEQLCLAAAEGSGPTVGARVLAREYYGHDAVVTVALLAPEAAGLRLVARTGGSVAPAPDTVVALSVSGPVVALAR